MDFEKNSLKNYTKKAPPQTFSCPGRGFFPIRLFAEIVLDALADCLCHLVGVWRLQVQDWGLVVVVIVPAKSLRAIPVKLLGSFCTDIVAGSIEVVSVCESAVVRIEAALDVVAQTVTNKTLSLVRDNRALAVLLDHQNIRRFCIREAGIVEGAYLLCRVEVCLAQLLDDLLCQLAAGLVYYKYLFASPKCVQCHKKFPP